MITKQQRSPHGGKIRTVSLKFTSNFRLVGAVFVYSSLVALCYVDALCYGTFRSQVPRPPGPRSHAPPPAIIRDRPLMEYRPLLEDLRYIAKMYSLITL